MNIDKAVADVIGNLTLNNLKQAAVIDALKAELARKDAIIQQLNEAAKDTAPDVPVPKKKGANGATAHEHH